MLECYQYEQCALVCRSRRQQRECAADHFPDHSRHVQGAQIGLPKVQRGTPTGIAVDSQTAGEIREPLKIQSSPKCPTRGRRSATAKSSPCGIVSETRKKFRRAAYVGYVSKKFFTQRSITSHLVAVFWRLITSHLVVVL